MTAKQRGKKKSLVGEEAALKRKQEKVRPMLVVKFKVLVRSNTCDEQIWSPLQTPAQELLPYLEATFPRRKLSRLLHLQIRLLQKRREQDVHQRAVAAWVEINIPKTVTSMPTRCLPPIHLPAVTTPKIQTVCPRGSTVTQTETTIWTPVARAEAQNHAI